MARFSGVLPMGNVPNKLVTTTTIGLSRAVGYENLFRGVRDVNEMRSSRRIS